MHKLKKQLSESKWNKLRCLEIIEGGGTTLSSKPTRPGIWELSGTSLRKPWRHMNGLHRSSPHRQSTSQAHTHTHHTGSSHTPAQYTDHCIGLHCTSANCTCSLDRWNRLTAHMPHRRKYEEQDSHDPGRTFVRERKTIHSTLPERIVQSIPSISHPYMTPRAGT